MPEGNRLTLPIKNIGSGPALAVTVHVTAFNAPEVEDRPTTLVGLGVSEMTTVTVTVPGLGKNLGSFKLWMTYVDVAEKMWITRADYAYRRHIGGVYVNLSIEETKTEPTKGRRFGLRGRKTDTAAHDEPDPSTP